MSEICRPDRIVAIVLSFEAYPELLPLSDFLKRLDGFRGEAFSQLPLKLDWFGFYDWLRNEQGTVVGVEMNIDAEEGIDDKHFTGHVGVKVISSKQAFVKSLTIFFHRDENFCDSKSADQAFGGNYLFRGSKGSTALTFIEPQKFGVMP